MLQPHVHAVLQAPRRVCRLQTHIMRLHISRHAIDQGTFCTGDKNMQRLQIS